MLNNVNLMFLENYMCYNNNFEFVLKILGKNFPVKIIQTSKLIECHYNCIEYSQKTRFIDTDLKLAMKHFFIQMQVDYFDSISNEKNLTSNDLGFFSSMFVLRGLTSAPSVGLLNLNEGVYKPVSTTFFSDKKICGAIGNQYLSPIISFIFTEDWFKLDKIHKYQKILDYDINFNLKMLNNINCLAESFWESKLYSSEYNNFDNFLSYFKELLQQQYWIHNFGDFKIYKGLGSYDFYPEIYQILYDLKFNFDEETKKNIINFNTLFLEKDLLNSIDLGKYKNIEDFKTLLLDWRNRGEIFEYKKNLIFLGIVNEKYILDDYVEQDLKDSFKSLFENSKKDGVLCYMFLIDEKNLNFQKLKFFLNTDKISFYYYIPHFETILSNNLLLIGFKKEYSDFFSFFPNNFLCIYNSEEIISYLIKNINWKNTDLYNHYLYWSDDSQIFVSSFLDFISGGLVGLLPKTWNN